MGSHRKGRGHWIKASGPMNEDRSQRNEIGAKGAAPPTCHQVECCRAYWSIRDELENERKNGRFGSGLV